MPAQALLIDRVDQGLRAGSMLVVPRKSAIGGVIGVKPLKAPVHAQQSSFLRMFLPHQPCAIIEHTAPAGRIMRQLLAIRSDLGEVKTGGSTSTLFQFTGSGQRILPRPTILIELQPGTCMVTRAFSLLEFAVPLLGRYLWRTAGG